MGIAVLIAASGASCETAERDAAPATNDARDIRERKLTRPEILAAFDRALVRRNGEFLEGRARAGDVIDAAIASGELDEDRARRAASGAVLVDWYGMSEGTDADNKLIRGYVGVMFCPLTGPRSEMDFEASIESAKVGSTRAEVAAPEVVPLLSVEAGAPPGLFYMISLPEGSKSKTLTVTWKVRVFDRATKKTLGEPWNWIEFIELPTYAQRRIEGRRVRFPGG